MDDSDVEQLRMLRESAIDVVARGIDTKRLRARRGTVPGYDAAYLRQMTDMGWLGLLVPEAHGGLGLGLTEMATVLQELGKGLMADPLPAVALATQVLVHAQGWAGAGERLAALARGEALAAVAWQEGLGGIDPAALDTTAVAEGSGWRLSGRKRFVAGAAAAAGFIVSARGASGVGLFWVGADTPGASLALEWRADETPIGVLILDKVPVAASAVICAPGAQGLPALQRALDETAVLASAEMLGVMEAALQMTLAYLRTRVQFGKPIGSFQALQHKAADLYVQQELLRAVLQDALRGLAPGADPLAVAQVASRCKARASDAGLRTLREVIQLHGAIGYTDEHDAGLYLKRALVLSAWLGNASAHRNRFAALQEQAAA
ncbi:MAG: acyl-CoA dehydrogenase family protein [Burkholderiaceae bacterium]|nr:acyl-CoA dehydrogenase family protein [Burkholderiaceae bacterium]